MRIAVTGSSGLIGRALVARLEAEGHSVIRLVRRPPNAPTEVRWDPAAGALDPASLAGVEAAVHLAGEGIGTRRWNEAHKRRILDSRVEGTTLLARTLAALDPLPRVLVSASAVGFYGDRGDEVLTEDSSGGEGFLAGLVRRWEASTLRAEEAGIRTVHVRTGLVVSGRGGFMGRLLPLFKVGLGGTLAGGRQWWSWISMADEVGLFRHALLNESVAGPMNAGSPNPVTNAEFTKALARVLRRPAVLPVPAFALKLAMGPEMAREVILSGQRMAPRVALATGYRFEHETVEDGLRAAVNT